MRFGATYHVIKQSNSPITQTAIKKYRDGKEYIDEIVSEERVQILKIQDFDTITTQMHIDHALQDHGAWVEYRDGKMYVVKSWIEKNN